jgi:hypothetical protein
MNYIENQLLKVAPFPLYDGSKNGEISLKITSERGATNWMGITPAQLREIERVLNPEPSTNQSTKHEAKK